jgi:hypothetical protein
VCLIVGWGVGTQKLRYVRVEYCVVGGPAKQTLLRTPHMGRGADMPITLGKVGVQILLWLREQGLFSCEWNSVPFAF